MSQALAESVTFQLISDVHLEFRGEDYFPPIEPVAPILLLCGDIGYPKRTNYRNFLYKCADMWPYVLLVAGNHEFYSDEYKSVKQLLRVICQARENVFFLDKECISVFLRQNQTCDDEEKVPTLDDNREKDKSEEEEEEKGKCIVELKEGYCAESELVILGTTLWTDIPFEHASEVAFAYNDFKSIKVNKKSGEVCFSVVQQNKFHEKEAAWLQENLSIAKSANQKVVVMTHHAPTWRGTLDPKVQFNCRKFTEYSDMESCMSDTVVLWCFGHTHRSSKTLINGCYVVSNQLGYPNEEEVGEDEDKLDIGCFDPSLVLGLSPPPDIVDEIASDLLC